MDPTRIRTELKTGALPSAHHPRRRERRKVKKSLAPQFPESKTPGSGLASNTGPFLKGSEGVGGPGAARHRPERGSTRQGAAGAGALGENAFPLTTIAALNWPPRAMEVTGNEVESKVFPV